MKIITSGLKPRHRLDYAAIVRRLLRFVLPEHLKGIAHITISGSRPIDDDDDVLGQYFERWEQDPAGVVIYLETMKREAPRLFHPFPITWEILIAQTLFHEIGHHYQRFSHGIAKQRQEEHAEAYGQRLTREAFPGWCRLIDALAPVRRRWNRVVIAWLEFQVRLFPLSSTRYEIGRRWWDDGDLDRVILHWEEALRINPRSRSVQSALREARWVRSREQRRQRFEAQASFELRHRMKHRAARRRAKGRRGKK